MCAYGILIVMTVHGDIIVVMRVLLILGLLTVSFTSAFAHRAVLPRWLVTQPTDI